MRSQLLSAVPPRGPTIAATLADAGRRIARADAEVLLAHALGVARSALVARDTDVPPAAARAAFEQLVRRRAAGEPVAYLRGFQEFWSLELAVGPGVLVPRHETELLVEWGLEVLPSRPGAECRVLDLGTGSGAIALALARERPDASIIATDLSPLALDVARGNARRLDVRNVAFAPGEGFAALGPAPHREGAGFHLIVSNPPYVADGDPHLAALRFEPRLALAAGPDGLDVLRRIAQEAPAYLERGGWLLLEHGMAQGAAVRALLGAAGLGDVQTRRDLAGLERASGGRRP